jgi:DNA helicase-2/ATP-dependent DNA helicase PcrA
MSKNIIIKKLPKVESIQNVPTHHSFKIDYENILNPAQFKAVSSIEGHYLLIAGAGTGKTQTLVYRVARLIELGTNPSEILLLTFTRKAAQEMMNRASLLLDARCSKILGGTFHSFANLILRKHAKAIQLDPSFTILDQGDCEDIINLIKGELKLNLSDTRFPKKETIYKIYNLSINTKKEISDIISRDYPHFKEHIDNIKLILSRYIQYKVNNNLLDYDDLLIYLNKFILSDNPVAEKFLETIKFIMVDEYQDTNYLQSVLVKNLAKKHNNIMVVGDDSQSIYSFRGADIQNILNFPNDFQGTKIIKLEENYRSTQSILNFTNYIISQSIYKFDKVLFTRRPSGNLPVIISAKNENTQSRFIVNQILELRESGVELNEIAVLFRNSYFSFDLELELSKANIPFIKIGGMKFVETAHIKDVLAFLRISSNIKDFVSWYRVLLLHDGIGPKKAQAIINELNSKNYNYSVNPEVLKSKHINDKLFNLFLLLYELNKKKYSTTEKIQLILNYYEPIFSIKYDDFNKRKKDLEIFLAISERYKSTESFLTDMVLEPPRDSIIDIEAEDKDKELLTLSTIHSAKGLEWHTVFIIHLLEGFFPSSQSIDDINKIEEERRLMYVAATRAKQNLYISYPNLVFDRYSGYTISKPSRFISAINPDLAENWIVSEEEN